LILQILYIYIIGILWALILDGIFVKRGNNYVKIRVIDHKFQKPFKTFIFYLIEIAFISLVISFLAREFIPNLLRDKPYLILILSVLVGYGRFRKDIYGSWLPQS
tara:strand:- start:914 stop:1228 length:315 start_codon:yes stop_codon:yes gene_type:complete